MVELVVMQFSIKAKANQFWNNLAISFTAMMAIFHRHILITFILYPCGGDDEPQSTSKNASANQFY
jgi:hypothetical protein